MSVESLVDQSISTDELVVPSTALGGLRRLNLVMGLLHAGSASAMLALSNDFAIPITATFADGPPGSPLPAAETLLELPLGPAVAAFLILSAIAHFVVASPLWFGRYARDLASGINRARWVEYSLSASWMIVLIALLPGITDVVALGALFAVNAGMILFGWMMELHNRRLAETRWTAFVFGCVLGVVPWALIGFQVIGAGSAVPTFVYGIFVSLVVFFNCFAVNQWLQYRQIGRWRDYLFGERVYVWLSITAKSVLAWQVFANTLIPT